MVAFSAAIRSFLDRHTFPEEDIWMYCNFMVMKHLHDDHDAAMYCPTLKIDQIWHAHLLDTRNYQESCFATFGRLLHHNPGGGDDVTSQALRYLITFSQVLQDFESDPSLLAKKWIRGFETNIKIIGGPEDECSICLDQKCTVWFRDCSHCVVCVACYKKMTQNDEDLHCPMCKSFVSQSYMLPSTPILTKYVNFEMQHLNGRNVPFMVCASSNTSMGAISAQIDRLQNMHVYEMDGKGLEKRYIGGRPIDEFHKRALILRPANEEKRAPPEQWACETYLVGGPHGTKLIRWQLNTIDMKTFRRLSLQDYVYSSSERNRDLHVKIGTRCPKEWILDHKDCLGERMLIFVKTLQATTIVISALGSDSVKMTKVRIFLRTGISSCLQRIIYAGKQLDDNKCLEDYGIRSESTLHLVEKIRGC